jgi:hypothetical protein
MDTSIVRILATGIQTALAAHSMYVYQVSLALLASKTIPRSDRNVLIYHYRCNKIYPPYVFNGHGTQGIPEKRRGGFMYR